jgi:lipoprotein NlpD
VAALALVLAGCAAPTAQRAPVTERSPQPAARAAAAPLPPGAENAGLPGFYTVRPGDTLIRIGLETGQSWRDIAAWNGITNPDRIEVGQVLRVVPPVAVAAAAARPAGAGPVAAAPAGATPAPAAAGTTAAPVATPSVQGRPLTDPAPVAAPEPPRAASGEATPVAAAPAPAAGAAETISLIWPAAGPVIESFDESRNKGIGIAGRAGDPVLAAAAGRVVYAGSGLRGYGNLVIIKHNNTFLTAYAHNQALLVREDQMVRQGQRIADMGSSDADRVKLHFEVRRQGRPVDPSAFLPRR